MRSTEYKTIKVYFEVTNYCNFRCDFCPMQVSKRKMQHMDFALFEKGIEDIVRDHVADTVGFHVLGEPLLYPKIFDAISHANRQGLRTEVNTNGSLLTQDRVQRLVEARLDTLCVSLQIMDPQEHVCRGSSLPFDVYYQRVMDAVRLIKRSQGQMGAPRPGSSLTSTHVCASTASKALFEGTWCALSLIFTLRWTETCPVRRWWQPCAG